MMVLRDIFAASELRTELTLSFARRIEKRAILAQGSMLWLQWSDAHPRPERALVSPGGHDVEPQACTDSQEQHVEWTHSGFTAHAPKTLSALSMRNKAQ